MNSPGACAQEHELSRNRVLSDPEEPRHTPLRDARAEKLLDDGVDVPLFLAKALRTSGGREGTLASAAQKAAQGS